jgi:hypothetical protein
MRERNNITGNDPIEAGKTLIFCCVKTAPSPRMGDLRKEPPVAETQSVSGAKVLYAVSDFG